MTTKLKRKLENIGIDIHSNVARFTENFCLIGTPLPPLEKSKDNGEFVPLWKQEVRDEKGRRRLHGAFTGGFSAGYFNTVGSKEGWTPSTFVSSRSDRAKAKQARPEDFMDEEDRAEIKESRRLVDTTDEHDIFADTRSGLNGDGVAKKDPMAAALKSLLPPIKDSIGVRILKKMGWRPGQGIGPRITYQQLREQEGSPIQPGEQVDEENLKHLYAPRDTDLVLFNKKDNAFGLGYVPGDSLIGIVGNNNAQVDADLGPNISAGFGLGALNDAEDDDIDVYYRGGSKTHQHMAYDTRDEDANDHIVVRPRFPLKSTLQNVAESVTFKDGHPVVSGFVVSEVPLVENRRFPFREVPEGWAPDPRRVWLSGQSGKQDQSKPLLSIRTPEDWVKGKTANERGTMLGEIYPSTPHSVFDYLSQKDRDRLKNMATSLASGEAFPKTSSKTQTVTSVDMPALNPQTAEAAMKGFQPFSKDPEKQLRYNMYLQSQRTPATVSILRPLPGQSLEEFRKEIADYVKSAQIFKPVTGAMASRFASSATVEVIGVQHPGLYQPTQEDYAKLDLVKNDDLNGKREQEDPKTNAARLNMFGPMTRDTEAWIPARLLLKRFGVKDPYPDGEDQPISGLTKDDAWQEEVLQAAPGLKVLTASSSTTDDANSKPLIRDLTNIGLGGDEEQGKDTLTYERPSMDIFKAIFASDEEDSDEEPETKEEESANDNAPSELVPSVSQLLTTYGPNAIAQDAEKVDMSTFRPTFVPRSERKDHKQEKRDKKDKKKKPKIVVSFDVEEDGEAVISPRKVEEKGKKERPHKRVKAKVIDEDLDEGMWVEKPAPEVVKEFVLPTSVDPMPDDEVSAHPKGRKRAVDFI